MLAGAHNVKDTSEHGRQNRTVTNCKGVYYGNTHKNLGMGPADLALFKVTPPFKFTGRFTIAKFISYLRISPFFLFRSLLPEVSNNKPKIISDRILIS